MPYSRCALELSVALLLVVPAVSAQHGAETSTTQRHLVVRAEDAQHNGVPHVMAAPVEEIQIGMKTVKGAPYSAETQSETVQTLADGNRIIRRSNSRVYRDSEGRTRHEYSFAPGEAAGGAGVIAIHDPVGGVDYTLHTESKTAEKIIFSQTVRHISEKAAGTAEWQAEDNSRFFIRAMPHETVSGVEAQPGLEKTFVVHVTEQDRAEQNLTSESLGRQVMEGVEVEGKRTSVTLPAGAIGNELPIVTTTETWFSPELQTTIYSRREDPRVGTTIFRVTKLVRGEPDAALFRLPAEYSLREGGVNHTYRIEAPPKN